MVKQVQQKLKKVQPRKSRKAYADFPFPKLLPIRKQDSIIEECIQNNLSLDKVLADNGLSYDNLRYRLHAKPLKSQSVFQTIDQKENRFHGVPAISFFSGAGGMDLGFEAAGFLHLAAFEINELFISTLKYNRPEWNVFGPPEYSGDVRDRDLTLDILRNKIGVGKSFEGIFHGGPPCQPFSIASNQRFSKGGDKFKRMGFKHKDYGNLLFDYTFYISKLKPRVFLIENVTGLKELDGGTQLCKAIQQLENVGYYVNPPITLNAKQYGVPQDRERLFIIGSRKQNGFHLPEVKKELIPSWMALERTMQDNPNYVTRKHKAQSVSRYMDLDVGKRDKLGRVDRLDPDIPSKTVIAGGIGGGGRSHLHPFHPRTLSVRESARLQTFPDNYIFQGPVARQFTQVGNAVPPILAYEIARAIKKTLFK